MCVFASFADWSSLLRFTIDLHNAKFILFFFRIFCFNSNLIRSSVAVTHCRICRVFLVCFSVVVVVVVASFWIRRSKNTSSCHEFSSYFYSIYTLVLFYTITKSTTPSANRRSNAIHNCTSRRFNFNWVAAARTYSHNLNSPKRTNERANGWTFLCFCVALHMRDAKCLCACAWTNETSNAIRRNDTSVNPEYGISHQIFRFRWFSPFECIGVLAIGIFA